MSPARTGLFGTVVLLASMLPLGALAQQPDTSQQQLPEIAPREIEIRGELQVSFPTLERQPLQGFAAPPTVPSVPEDRTPYLNAYKQELEDLPGSLPAPEAVSESVSRPAPAKEGVLEFGGGRYASRFAEGHLTLPLSPRQRLLFDANYFGTEGFSPFSGGASDVSTPADQADGRVQFVSRHDALTLRAAARGAASRYTLYGEPALAQSSALAAPQA